MNIKKLLGKKIQKIRKTRGITQEKLAELVELDTSSISHIENGKYYPSAENLEKIHEIAQAVIDEYGFDYEISVEETKMFFDERTYGDITMPAGDYNAVRVTIGSAEGHNWWCVMYPPLCFVDGVATVNQESSNLLRSELGDAEYELITESDSPGVQIKFKLAEVLGSL